jgi:hypothetical protein
MRASIKLIYKQIKGMTMKFLKNSICQLLIIAALCPTAICAEAAFTSEPPEAAAPGIKIVVEPVSENNPAPTQWSSREKVAAALTTVIVVASFTLLMKNRAAIHRCFTRWLGGATTQPAQRYPQWPKGHPILKHTKAEGAPSVEDVRKLYREALERVANILTPEDIDNGYIQHYLSYLPKQKRTIINNYVTNTPVKK